MKKILLISGLAILTACDPVVEQEIFEEFIVAEIESEDTTNGLIEPVEGFLEGAELKPFGIYVTPSNSPVDPERFSGYHTGVDIEFEDNSEIEIAVYAIADGEVKIARYVNGYGGVMILLHDIDGQQYSVLYGHLDIDSLNFSVGDTVKAGDQLAVLGEGYTSETDGERAHLHFSVKSGEDLDLRGYVSSEEELSDWINPFDLFL